MKELLINILSLILMSGMSIMVCISIILAFERGMAG